MRAPCRELLLPASCPGARREACEIDDLMDLAADGDGISHTMQSRAAATIAAPAPHRIESIEGQRVQKTGGEP